MLDLESLKKMAGSVDFREKRVGVYKVLAPFFYEDGDMYDIFIEELGTDRIRISDYGLTLMKLSDAFDIDTKYKKEVLDAIIVQNRARIDNGMIYLDIFPHQFAAGINQFAQVVAKVTNMDIISRETQKSMFPEMLHTFVTEALKEFNVTEDFAPTDDRQLIVDYKIAAQRPIFLYGVGEDEKASKVVISCLTFRNQGILFRSLVVCEDMDSLSRFNRTQLTNVAQKQYYTLEGFREHGLSYIRDEVGT